MLLRCIVTTLFTLAGAVLGPDPLYQSLSPLTLFVDSPSGFRYRVEPYTEITQLGAQNLSCGTFQTYTAVNGLYAYHQYSGGSSASGCSPRAFQLTLACNGGSSAVTMGPITESPACTYHGTLYTPEACGIDFAVGQEQASASETPTPSASRTASASRTGSATATGTPMYFVTLFPTASPSSAPTPSGTPLFMVTAWPTTSPQNVSPSSTPLYFMTAYPTYDPTNGTLLGATGSSGSGNTATILGGVAVAGVAAGGVAFVVNHFRKGGSVKGLLATALKNKGQISKTLKGLPIPESMKAKILNAESLIPDSAKTLMKAAKSPQDLINNLPVPEELKAHLKRNVGNESMGDRIMKMLQDASGVELTDMKSPENPEEEANAPTPVSKEVPTIDVSLDEKPATSIVVDQGVQLGAGVSKKSVNIIVTSPTGTNSEA